jgi:nitronate monooxygenase
MTTAALHTALCKLLGIERPVLQSGMRGIASSELVAAVSQAGGLGILAGVDVLPDELRAQIERVRALTDRPFGVNLWLHEAMQPPLDPAAISDDALRGAQTVLNRFRSELGIAAQSARPARKPDLLGAQFELLLDLKVPVFSVGLGNPGSERVRRCRERGMRVMAMAASVGDARALDQAGVEVIVAQGSEAGGHRSTWLKPESPQAAAVGCMTLVAEICDAVRVPVIAAGGIADGRGLVAALALGAQGVMLGTRFVATRESHAPTFFKQAILAGDGDATRISDVYTGIYARGIRNRFMAEYEASGAPVLPPMLQRVAAQDIYDRATQRGDSEFVPMLAGQSMGLIHDLPSAAEVVNAIMGEAERILARLAG